MKSIAIINDGYWENRNESMTIEYTFSSKIFHSDFIQNDGYAGLVIYDRLSGFDYCYIIGQDMHEVFCNFYITRNCITQDRVEVHG